MKNQKGEKRAVNTMKKIGIATTTRAEYGILRPLILRLLKEPDFDARLYVTGTHLSPLYGGTQEEIIKDGMAIYRKIPILEEGNEPYDSSVTMANALKGFAEAFREDRPDLLVVLGDRTEILGICCAAMNERIPIAHLHGGERTEGAVDDCVRHAVTKMSYLHFPAAEPYRKRIIQMGEAPKRVVNAGSLGVENILNVPLLSCEEACRQAGIPEGRRYVVATFHPETLDGRPAELQVEPMIEAMRENDEYFYLITKANADAGGRTVNERLEAFASSCGHARLVASLGMLRYLSAVKYCAFALGNSSSGIIEAPALGAPSVNIGDRQKGRILADTVISCRNTKEEILAAMQRAAEVERRPSRIYGDGHASERIAQALREFFQTGGAGARKQFYDLEGI